VIVVYHLSTAIGQRSLNKDPTPTAPIFKASDFVTQMPRRTEKAQKSLDKDPTPLHRIIFKASNSDADAKTNSKRSEVT
jgi:hypothetical protein